MERYEKVFSLAPMLYTSGSPVIIEAGAIQKDNADSSVIAQLKFKSISSKTIKALTVRIIPLDTLGNALGEEIEYQYLDLSVNRNETFGTQNAISLPNNNTRAISVYVAGVVFDDKSNITLDKAELTSIPSQNELKLDKIESQYFYANYKISNEKEVLKHSDLWLCSCGAINHSNEPFCCCCNNSFDVLSNIDYTELHKEAYYQSAKKDCLSNNITTLSSANKKLNTILDYKDSQELFDENEKKIKSLTESLKKREGKIRISVIIAVIVSVILLSSTIVIKSIMNIKTEPISYNIGSVSYEIPKNWDETYNKQSDNNTQKSYMPHKFVQDNSQANKSSKSEAISYLIINSNNSIYNKEDVEYYLDVFMETFFSKNIYKNLSYENDQYKNIPARKGSCIEPGGRTVDFFVILPKLNDEVLVVMYYRPENSTNTKIDSFINSITVNELDY